MTDEDIRTHLAQIFVETFHVDGFEFSMEMEHIQEWDSLRHIHMLVAIEERFGLEIRFEDAIRMISGRVIFDTVKRYLNGE